MNKNILCISVMQSWGGGEEFLLNICKYVKDYNFFIASPKGKAFEIFNENNIKTIEVNSLKKFYRNSEKWNLNLKLKILLNVFPASFTLIKIIKSKKIDLILANGNFAGLYAFLPKIITRKKLVVVQHLIYEENSIEGKIIKVLYKFSDKLVCVSNAVAENIKSFIEKYSDDKISVIHNGVKIPENVIENHSDEIKIGMVGSLIKIKGIDLVLEALKDILIQKTNVKFYIYGEVTSESDSINYKFDLKNFTEINNIENKVFFCGHLNDKNRLYNNFDILINFTSKPEAFPVSILEAMAYKKIVIAQNEGGPKEIIKGSFNGFLIEKGNKNQLKEKIDFCIRNFHSDEINKIRNNARKTAAGNYSVESFAAEYKKLLDQLI